MSEVAIPVYVGCNDRIFYIGIAAAEAIVIFILLMTIIPCIVCAKRGTLYSFPSHIVLHCNVVVTNK